LETVNCTVEVDFVFATLFADAADTLFTEADIVNEADEVGVTTL